jgi:hypothetical protein
MWMSVERKDRKPLEKKEQDADRKLDASALDFSEGQ